MIVEPTKTEEVKPETREEKLARLRAEKEARDAAEAAKLADIEVLALEKDAEFSAKGLTRGVDFEIVQSAREVLVVVRKDGILFERFSHSDMTQLQLLEFVTPCVAYPEPTKAKAIFDALPALANRCALALSSIYGAQVKAKSGKF